MWLQIVPLFVLILISEHGCEDSGDKNDTVVSGVTDVMHVHDSNNDTELTEKLRGDLNDVVGVTTQVSVAKPTKKKKKKKKQKKRAFSTTSTTLTTTSPAITIPVEITTLFPTTITTTTTRPTTTITTTTRPTTTTTTTTTTRPTTTTRTTTRPTTTTTTTPPTTTTQTALKTTPKTGNDKVDIFAAFNWNYLYFLFLLIPIGIIPFAIIFCKRKKKKDSSDNQSKNRRRSIPSWVFSDPDFADEEVVTLNEQK